MTVNVVRRRRPRSRLAEPGSAAPSLPIGEIDQTIFACPGCSRPLALGSHRCPGCGTRLVMGVQLRRASLFVVAGVAVGLLVGAGGAAATFALNTRAAGHGGAAGIPPADAGPPGSGGVESPAPTRAPSAMPSPTPTASARPGVPALSRSALGQAVALSDRLRTSSAALDEAMSAKPFDTFAVSQALRAMSSDALVGLQLTHHIAAWPGGSAIAAELTAYYGEIQRIAADGLGASVRNAPAYRAAGKEMQTLLDGLDTVDAAVRVAASAAGVVLPAASAAP
jgi:hypothetical protein